MTQKLIGREKEIKTLQRFLHSDRAEFLALYGRRRVGKTFLIHEFFKEQDAVFFSATGLKEGLMQEQLKNFTQRMSETFYHGANIRPMPNWDDTFHVITRLAEQSERKIVVFLDELPWMATPKSNLLRAIDYFWNQYWSWIPHFKLIVCGSSASWIIKNIINNTGGLHNRITYNMHLRTFNLPEVSAFLKTQGVQLENRHLTEIYMMLGGVPHYLNQVEKGLSSAQVIEKLAFDQHSFLMREFDKLFSSLFRDAQTYIDIVSIIAQHRYGLGQNDLLKKLGKSHHGKSGLSKLKDLEEAGFILSFTPLFHKEKGIYYRVIDFYCLFYLFWILPTKNHLMTSGFAPGYWAQLKNQNAWHSWAGLTFEALCYEHLSQISKALELSVTSLPSTWRYSPKKGSLKDGAQIDLLFDRDDDAITLCEIKYTAEPFVIDKAYAEKLRKKMAIFKQVTGTKKQLFMAMISASGVRDNAYARDLLSGIVTLDDLFKTP